MSDSKKGEMIMRIRKKELERWKLTCCLILACSLSLGSGCTTMKVKRLARRLKSKDAKERKATAEELGEIADRDKDKDRSDDDDYENPASFAIPSLVELLKDEDESVRRTAAEALGKIRSKKATSALLEALTDDNAEIRAACVNALGKIGDRSAVDALMILMKDIDPNVRHGAAWALGQLREERAVPALIEGLSDNDEDVRWWCVFALEEITPQLKPSFRPSATKAERDKGIQKWLKWWEENERTFSPGNTRR